MPKRHLREIVVVLGIESIEHRKRIGHDLLIYTREVGIEGIVAARRLLSGDVVVIIENKKRREVVKKRLKIRESLKGKSKSRSKRLDNILNTFLKAMGQLLIRTVLTLINS